MTQQNRAIVSPEELLASLDDPDLGLLEISNSAEVGRAGKGALPGARAVYWKDLVWDRTRRLIATPEELSQRLFALGLGKETRIVLYGTPLQYGSYALWALRVRGYRNIGFLDGGLEAWQALGYPLAGAREIERNKAATPLDVPLPTDEDTRKLIGRDGVLAALEDENTVILDHRSPDEYAGLRVGGGAGPKDDHGAERYGRIPGARHLFFRELLDDIGRLKPAEEIRRIAAERGVFDKANIIGYCRLSHRASLSWLALTEVLGLENARVYDGSWTEWGSIVGVPIENDAPAGTDK